MEEKAQQPPRYVCRVPSPKWCGPSSLTGMLHVQKKVPVDVLRPQGHIPPSLLHKEKRGKLNLDDEELEPG